MLVYLVRGHVKRWRSHHLIRHTGKSHAACKLYDSVPVMQLLPIKVLHIGNKDLRRFFAHVTLTLTR